MTRTLILQILLLILVLNACNVRKNSLNSNAPIEQKLNDLIIKPIDKKSIALPYQASETRHFELEHTILDLSFDYEKQFVNGKAVLILTPYFYDQQELKLDAKKFTINRIGLIQKDTQNLPYTYDETTITIDLKRAYIKGEKLIIYIDYIAKPNEITDEGSRAISSAKGLYFINPTRQKPNYPRQIWSQGETQSNSGWFPTIDKPNEKMTQEIYLTVDKTDITLSNGVLMYSRDLPNGKRQDYWKQNLPHAPYLTMIAIGEFTETKDFWRDSIEVNYYLEQEYQPYAKMIFGNTPEMMECFSTKLGIDYPWQKFSQIVVREFVSGAMENTSAVIHFDKVQHNYRQHLDNPWEDIIVHELFHHWFGDLVTCESWSNIPLNESFATYGEYIWDEYKYGKMFADYNFENNLNNYLNQSLAAGKNVIRYNYKQREDMFDVVSYQKGSRILHMLRKHVGDQAFFTALKHYLTQHAYGTVEIHNLRLAFEKITGQDLNWFFNQWFLGNGHPILTVDHEYSSSKKEVTITIKQIQDTMQYSVFKLPMAIDVYLPTSVKRELVCIDKTNWSIKIKSDTAIELVIIDAENQLLAQVDEVKTMDEFYTQLERSNSYIDLSQAVVAIIASRIEMLTPRLKTNIEKLLNHSFFGVRELGLEMISVLPDSAKLVFEKAVVSLATSDQKSSVRSEAITILRSLNSKHHKALFIIATNDSAYSVVESALLALADQDDELALKFAIPYFETKNPSLQYIIASIIAQNGKGDYQSYFENQIPQSGVYIGKMLKYYANYLIKQDTAIVINALPFLANQYQSGNLKIRYKECLEQINAYYKSEIVALKEKMAKKKQTFAETQKWEQEHNKFAAIEKRIQMILNTIQTTEK